MNHSNQLNTGLTQLNKQALSKELAEIAPALNFSKKKIGEDAFRTYFLDMFLKKLPPDEALIAVQGWISRVAHGPTTPVSVIAKNGDVIGIIPGLMNVPPSPVTELQGDVQRFIHSRDDKNPQHVARMIGKLNQASEGVVILDVTDDISDVLNYFKSDIGTDYERTTEEEISNMFDGME